MFAAYAAAAVLFGLAVMLALRDREPHVTRLRSAGLAAVALGMALAAGIMAHSWTRTGHPPFQTLYQTLIFFSATTAAVYLFIGWRSAVMGLLTALFLLAILGYEIGRASCRERV